MQFTFQQGARYRAKLKLGLDEIGYDNDTLRTFGYTIGLRDVSVTGGGTVRRVVGTWGASTQTLELPSQIVQVDEVESE